MLADAIRTLALHARHRAHAAFDHRRRLDDDRPIARAARRQLRELFAVPHELACLTLARASLGSLGSLASHGRSVSSPAMEVRLGDFDDPRVIDLLREHLAGMHASSPPGSVYALDLSGLRHPLVSFYTVWDGEDLMSCGALKHVDRDTAELKSMRTTARHLRRGAAAFMLEHLITIAQARRYARVCLETGSGSAFEPALALYRKHGFTPTGAFGDYVASEFNQFLELALPN